MEESELWDIRKSQLAPKSVTELDWMGWSLMTVSTVSIASDGNFLYIQTEVPSYGFTMWTFVSISPGGLHKAEFCKQ